MSQVPSAAWRPYYQGLLEQVTEQYQAIPDGAPVRLAKATSNLFRPRAQSTTAGLDVKAFDGVLAVDPITCTAEVLGMTTYEHLVDATLAYGLMPMCVPQLRTITLGGAVTGLGIESASFRFGTPHESVREMDILTGDGHILTVTGAEGDPHRDLFYGFPNSYGSLGYALRLKIELEPVKKYVRLRHVPFATATAMAAAISQIVDSGSQGQYSFQGQQVDFCDGTVFSPTEQYLTLGLMTDELPDGQRPSDYTGMDIYYRSVQSKTEDVLTIKDYLWRWDTDWFWCSRAFGAQRTFIRRLWPKAKLRSDVYWKLVALDRKWDLSGKLAKAQHKPAREPVVQDIEVPVDQLAAFLDFFHSQVQIEPIWVCPLKQRDPRARWPLYEFDPAQTYVNVGFWSTVAVPDGATPEDGVINRLIEAKVTELDGRKSLYSTAFYARDDFYAIYGGADYQVLKSTYDPTARLLGLYEKVVERR